MPPQITFSSPEKLSHPDFIKAKEYAIKTKEVSVKKL